MGSVCSGCRSIGLMTGFSPAADNVPIGQPGFVGSLFLLGRGASKSV